MSDTPEHLARRLQEEGEKTLAFFNRIAPEQWDLPLYSDGSQWAIRQLLSHIATSEAAMGKLIENILAGGPGSSEDFSIDRFNESQVAHMKGASPASLLEHYRQARQKNVTLVSGLSQADLDLVGRHPFLGMTTLNEIIKMIYRHNQIHLRDARKVIG